LNPIIQKLESLERLGWRFGLESVRALMRELYDPHQGLRFLHVAGSNGKGSTCAYLAAFLRQHRYRVGLYTSPHLSDLRERFRVNGRWIPEGDLRRLGASVLEACRAVRRKTGHLPTHFEALTVLAALWFKEQRVDWVVWEVGLGGRLDATNVIDAPAVSLITPVTLEHQDILGNGLFRIASEKAGIFKAGSLAATFQPRSQALDAVERAAARQGVPLWVGGKDFHFRREKEGFRWEGPGLAKSFQIPRLPDFQISNASLALAGIQLLQSRGVHAEPSRIQKALVETRWPGRLEVLCNNPLVVLDGAHNPAAAQALVSALKMKYPGKRWIVLNGFLRDKNYRDFCRILKPLTAFSVTTRPRSERAEAGEKVFRSWETQGVRGALVGDWRKALGLALAKAENSGFPLLITGSLYLLGDCRKELAGLKGLEKI